MSGLVDKLRQLLKAGPTAKPGEREPGPAARRPAQRSSGPRWADQETDVFSEQSRTKAKAPPGQTQSQKPNVTPYYVWGTFALLTAGFAVAGITYHLLREGVEERSARGTGLADPLLPLQGTAREALLRPSPELGAELKRSFGGKPDALCTELRSLGLGNPGWRKAPFQTNRWQCASDLVELTTPSVDFGSTTLFFLLRGPSEDKVDYLRLKLAVEDPRQKQIGLEAVWLVIDALAGRYGWTVPEDFREAVAGFEKLETTHHGVRLSVAPEDPNLTGDPLAAGRLNIIMNFGEPDLIRPADRFEQAPPLESGWSLKDRNALEEE